MALSHSPSVVTDGLVLCLDAGNPKSYPGSGTVWTDLSGRGNHVTLFNSPSFSSGSITFPGTNEYARTVSPLNLSSTQAITIISAWKTPTTTTSCMVYEYSNNWNTSSNGFGFSSNSTGGGAVANFQHIQLRGNVGFAGSNSPSPPSTSFQIYSVTHDFAKASSLETTVYINGKFVRNGDYSSDNTNTGFGTEHLYIGSRAGTSVFGNLTLGFLLIYSRSLSSEEISQNYIATRGRFGL
jgi:hypothetical protein